jgi:copper transport protein
MRWISIVLVAMTSLIYPTAARAHAHLTRSVPVDGGRLDTSPQQIRLWFSERPESSMTFAQLRDSTGRQYPLGPFARQQSDLLGIQYAVLEELPAGRYTLAWRAAGADGHPSRGEIVFDVASQPMSSAGQSSKQQETQSDQPPALKSKPAVTMDSAASPAHSIARAGMLIALVGLIGCVVFALLVVKQAPISTASSDRMMHRAAFIGVAASVILLVVSLVRLRFETQMIASMADMPGMHHLSSREMIMQTSWGFAFRLQIVSAFTALIAFFFASRRSRTAWLVAAIAALAAAITPALSGHAAAAASSTRVAIATDWIHVLGAGTWLGTLFLLALVGIPVAIADEGECKWQSVSALVTLFSRIAIFAVSAVVASGIIAAWMHLSQLSDLWETRYGVILLIKLALVAVALGLGAYNFSRVQPQLGVESSTLRLKKSAALELSAGLLILLVTGVLTGVSQ